MTEDFESLIIAAEPITAIESFFGPYRFLSNFWPAAVKINGHVFPTVEHAYVYAKLKDDERTDEMATYIISLTAGQVKRFGRTIALRPNWDNDKLQLMEVCLLEKFLGHPRLRRALIATGDLELIEGNTWGDTFWGVCRGVGENHLGKLLMKIRGELSRDVSHIC